SEMPGILDKLPIRRGKKFLQSQVDADRLTGFGKWAFRNVITGKGDPPVAAPVPAKRDGLDAPLDRPRKKQLRRADPLKGEPPAVELPGMLPQGHAVVARATLDTRITGLLTLLHTAEERLKRPVKPLDYVLQYLASDHLVLKPELLDLGKMLLLR